MSGYSYPSNVVCNCTVIRTILNLYNCSFCFDTFGMRFSDCSFQIYVAHRSNLLASCEMARS